MTTPSFYWFDYETFGTSPRWDRPAQFAGLRTSMNLDVVGEPLVNFCRLPGDYLPEPEACRVTGLSPQSVHEKGLPEAAFIAQILAELGAPGTCAVGYNNIRFDDEFTRHTLFRNFHDAYAHEWQHGNSRWDLLDVVRLTRALRPEGIQWPRHDDGKPSNRLEHLTAANDLVHAQAHDALSDVYATIAVARLLREHQPRLFDYCFRHRGKQQVAKLLNVRQPQACLQVSGMIPAVHGHVAIVMPLVRHPVNSNGVIVFDLRDNPAQLEALDAERIAERVFSGGDNRLRLRTIHINRCPVVVPLATLREPDAERLGIDLAEHQRHAQQLLTLDLPGIGERVATAMARDWGDAPVDVDGSLYAGPFFSQADRQAMAQVRQGSAAQLGTLQPNFEDPRLVDMLFRYRARNYPDSLSDDETGRWREHCRERLQASDAEWLSFNRFEERLAGVDWRESHPELWLSLERYARSLAEALNVDRAVDRQRK